MAVHYGVAGVRQLITGVRLGVIEFPAPVASRLNRLFMRIAAANEEGDTLFDVKVNDVSIYGSPLLRPKILSGETTHESFPSVELAEGDMVTVDLVAAPLGGISGLYVIVQLQDAPTVTQYVKDAYNGALNRDPDAGELSAAVTALGSACAAETTLDATKTFFDGIFSSAEYVALATTNSEYLEDLYQAVLGRPSDPGGFSFWLLQLTGGTTRQALRDSFNASTEHVNQRVLGWCPNTLPLTNAIQLRGVPISTDTPTAGNSLVFDGTVWKPATPAIGARSDTNYVSGSLADAADEVGDVTIARSAMLLNIEADRASRVRLYYTEAARDADRARAEGADRAENDGLLAEFIFTVSLLSIATQDPVVMLYNLDGPTVADIYVTVENKSGSTHTVTVTLTTVTIEP